MDMEDMNGLMVEFMMDNGRKAKWKVKDNLHGQVFLLFKYHRQKKIYWTLFERYKIRYWRIRMARWKEIIRLMENGKIEWNSYSHY